jgi:hypothetical protein
MVEDAAPDSLKTADEDDDYLIALAQAHKADAVVSGDGHLLDVAWSLSQSGSDSDDVRGGWPTGLVGEDGTDLATNTQTPVSDSRPRGPYLLHPNHSLAVPNGYDIDAPYSSSVTCSPQVTALPDSSSC